MFMVVEHLVVDREKTEDFRPLDLVSVIFKMRSCAIVISSNCLHCKFSPRERKVCSYERQVDGKGERG